ncbi:MAG TPA: P1 family peptidase [Aggregatilineales bacterium]|nr:P1 family peptidase [Aggregatilineales bacterium]
MNNTLTDVPGIRVGHAQDLDAATGCTVILTPPNTVGGVDQRGGAPGTRETDLLHPLHLVQHVNAILLAGGSAFGLAAADGVMRYLEERGIGYATPAAPVPIVPAAILFDLDLGRADRRPDFAMGYAACQAASDDPVVQGSVGAGTGARIGSLMGMATATKGGIGSASVDLGDGLIVAALFAVNSAGDVIDENNAVLAGQRSEPDGATFVGVLNVMRMMSRLVTPPAGENTVIGIVATNAQLDKESVNKIAAMAHDGLARAIRPAHTMFDGDTIFALATGQIPANVNAIGAFGAEVTATAIRKAVLAATGLAGVPAFRDLTR